MQIQSVLTYSAEVLLTWEYQFLTFVNVAYVLSMK